MNCFRIIVMASDTLAQKILYRSTPEIALS